MDNKNIIVESVLDPVQKTRCKEVFDLTTDLMKTDVKEFILNILNDFKKNSGIEFNFKKIFMIGSSTGYQYTDTSDIDIEVVVDKPKKDFKTKFSLIPKGIVLPNTAKPVNVFMLFADDPDYNPDYAENIYDLLTDTWEKKSTLETSKIPYSYIAGLASFFMDGCEITFGKYARDKREIERYMAFDSTKVEISEQEKKEAISRKIVDIQNDADALKLAHHFMFALNNEGFADNPFSVRIGYKYNDPHYSINYLIYKYIDTFGYYEKINQIQKEATSIINTAKNMLKINQAIDTPEVSNKIEAQKQLTEAKASSQQKSEEDNEQYIVIKKDGTQIIVHTPEEQERLQKIEDAEKEKVFDENLQYYKTILKENGYEPTDKNVVILLSKLNEEYIIVDGHDPLDEDIRSSTERKLNKIIYKNSGKWNSSFMAVGGFLFSGIIGAYLLGMLGHNHNLRLDDYEQRLYGEIESDSDCQKIISEIKKELDLEKPDKSKLKSFKREFAAAVKECKIKMKIEDKKWNAKPRVSLAEEKED